MIVEGANTTGLVCRPYRQDQFAVVLRSDDELAKPPLCFNDLLDRDIVGLEGSAALTRLLSAQAAALQRPIALRVQVRSFESVCRAVQAQLGIGVLPLVAASGYALSLGLAVLPLSDAWARRRMLLCVRSEPAADTPLGLLAAHLKAYADSEATLSLPAT